MSTSQPGMMPQTLATAESRNHASFDAIHTRLQIPTPSYRVDRGTIISQLDHVPTSCFDDFHIWEDCHLAAEVAQTVADLELLNLVDDLMESFLRNYGQRLRDNGGIRQRPSWPGALGKPFNADGIDLYLATSKLPDTQGT